MPLVPLTRDGPVAAPLDYVVPQQGELLPVLVRAVLDGTSAAVAWYAVVEIIAPSGRIMGIGRSDSIAAGASADVSWFPLRRESAGQPGPSPNPLGTVWAWWDFSDSSTVTLVSSKIAAIADKSNNGHGLGQTTVAHRPSQTTVNGLNAAACDTATFTHLDGGPWAPSLPVPYTGFAVWTNPTAHSANHFPGATGTTDVYDTGLLFQSNESGNIFVQTNGGSIISTALTAPFTQTLVTATVNGASSSVRVNGAASFGTLSPTSLTDEVIGVAHVPDDTPFFSGLTGAVCEVILYESALSATQVAAVEAYLKAKWATP